MRQARTILLIGVVFTLVSTPVAASSSIGTHAVSDGNVEAVAEAGTPATAPPDGPPGEGGGTENGSANYSVASVSAPENVSQGRPARVEATIENVGDARGRQTVEFSVDGEVATSRPVVLGSGDSRTVGATIQTRGLDNGSHTLTVSTDDDSASTTFNVTESDRGPPWRDGDYAAFPDTSPLGPGAVEPVSLSGKIRVESTYTENTTVELVRNSSTNYTLELEVTGNATNVTFYLQKNAVAGSQNVSNVSAYLDGEEFNFTVTESHGGWLVFEVDHFSTRRVTFRSTATDGGSSAVDRYAGDRGEVTTRGLSDAVSDWSSGEISTSVLQRIVSAWASS